MEELFETYRPHPLVARMVAEIARLGEDYLMDDDFRSIAIDLIQQDMGTQGIVANRGQVGYWLGQAAAAQRDGE